MKHSVAEYIPDSGDAVQELRNIQPCGGFLTDRSFMHILHHAEHLLFSDVLKHIKPVEGLCFVLQKASDIFLNSVIAAVFINGGKYFAPCVFHIPVSFIELTVKEPARLCGMPDFRIGFYNLDKLLGAPHIIDLGYSALNILHIFMTDMLDSQLRKITIRRHNLFIRRKSRLVADIVLNIALHNGLIFSNRTA